VVGDTDNELVEGTRGAWVSIFYGNTQALNTLERLLLLYSLLKALLNSSISHGTISLGTCTSLLDSGVATNPLVRRGYFLG
jgi:hypothetical protein